MREEERHFIRGYGFTRAVILEKNEENPFDLFCGTLYCESCYRVIRRGKIAQYVCIKEQCEKHTDFSQFNEFCEKLGEVENKMLKKNPKTRF